MWVQVVYSGPLDQAAPYFKEVGFVPDELRSNIADYMLDLVIRASDADVAAMVLRFAGCVAFQSPVFPWPTALDVYVLLCCRCLCTCMTAHMQMADGRWHQTRCVCTVA